MRGLLLLLVVATAACEGAGPADPPPPAAPAATGTGSLASEVVALGRSVYNQNCAACHGPQGEGQPNWRQPGPNGELRAPPHDATGHTWHHGDGTLYDIVRYGGLTGEMPAWGARLSDAEIRAVLAYIKTFWGPAERAAQEAASRADPFRTPPPASD